MATSYEIPLFRPSTHTRKNKKELVKEIEEIKDRDNFSSPEQLSLEREIELQCLTMPKLKEMAKSINLKGYSKRKKDDLVQLIMQKEIYVTKGKYQPLEGKAREVQTMKTYFENLASHGKKKASSSNFVPKLKFSQNESEVKFNISKIQAFNIPYSVENILEVIDLMYNELKNKLDAEQEFFFQITGLMKTKASWEDENNEDSLNDPNVREMFMMPTSSLVFVKNLHEHLLLWLEKTEEMLTRMVVPRSGDFVEILEVMELTLRTKGITIRGGGNVQYLNTKGPIYCPQVKEDCLTYCLDEAKVNRQTPVSMLKYQEKLTGFISARNISKVLKYYEECTVIVHPFNNMLNKFSTTVRNSLKYSNIPKNSPKDSKDPKDPKKHPIIHLGLIYSHFFLVNDPAIFADLTAEDFHREDEISTSIDMTKEIPTRPLRKNFEEKHKEVSQENSQENSEEKPKENSKENSEENSKDIPNYMTNVCFYDLETYPDENGDHQVYNVGALLLKRTSYNRMRWNIAIKNHSEIEYTSNGKLKKFIEPVPDSLVNQDELGEMLCSRTKTFYGLNSWPSFEEWLLKISEEQEKLLTNALQKEVDKGLYTDSYKYQKLRNSLIMRHRIIFYAHNGAGYDSHFVYKSKILRFKSVVMANGIMQIESENGLLVFRDTMKLTGPTTLAKLCDAFKLPNKYKKTEFPHAFASKANIYYKGKIPEANYWPSNKIPESFSKDLPWDFQKVSLDYQILDCVSLALVFDKFCSSMYEVTGKNPKFFMSIPGYAYNYVIEGIDIELITDIHIDDYCRQSIQGGRTFPQKSIFISKQYEMNASKFENYNELPMEERKELYNNTLDYMVDFDAVSLYPSACVLFDYPVGKPFWVNHNEFDKYLEILNKGDFENINCSIIKCDIEFPNKEIITPLLSEKKNGKLQYNLLKKCEIIKTSVDLCQAVKYNDAVIINIHSILMWPDKKPIFKDKIQNLFNRRLKAKKDHNKPLDQAIKLLMNSFYGKTTQRVFDCGPFISDDIEEIDNLYKEFKVKHFNPLHNGQLFIEKYKRQRVVYPSHIGAFILAYSKVIMNRAIDSFNGFRDWNSTFYYTDTDSIHITSETYEKIPKQLIGKQLGQLHSDFDLNEGKAIRSIFIAPKVYIDEIIGKDSKGDYVMQKHIRAKGIRTDKASELNFKKFVNILDGTPVKFDNIRRFVKDPKEKSGPTGAVKTIKNEFRTIGKQRWDGRIYNEEEDRWYPYGN